MKYDVSYEDTFDTIFLKRISRGTFLRDLQTDLRQTRGHLYDIQSLKF